MKEIKEQVLTKIALLGIIDQYERLIDEAAVLNFSKKMNNKLALKREQGYGGWHAEECPLPYLNRLLLEHIEKGDMIDVANLAMMIYYKELEEN